jgi:hypothetical protein
MSSLLQDRFPFMTAGFFYCGFRVEMKFGPMKKSIKSITPIGALAMAGCASHAQFLISNQAMAIQTVDSDQ